MGDCCTDELVTHEASQFKAEVTQLASPDADFVVSLAFAMALLEVHGSPDVDNAFLFDSPPIVHPGRNVLFRVFLI
jgi:hypothetical protein